MKNAPVRHAVEFGAFALFQGVARALPHPASRALGGALGALAGRLDRRRLHTADANLAAAFPTLASAERSRITRACFRHFGASFCDALSSLRFDGPELLARLELVGWENFARAATLTQGKGTIVLGSHFGNWEVVPAAIALTVGPISSVGRRADNPHFDRVIQRLRTRYGNLALDKRGAVREMFRVLERGGRLGLLIDQRVRAEEGVDVPFFGRPASTSPIVARLSQRTGAPVVPVFGEELPGGRYRVEALEPMLPQAGDDDVTLSRRYLALLEERARARPELWLWLHDRWK
ncbi:MAG: lysophospholipid acyltransferase family protein, partial [Thermoanaerobaculia bacterium]